MFSKVDNFFNKTVSIVERSWDTFFLKNKEIQTTDTFVKNKPYSKLATVHTCISTTARAISQIPLLVEQKVNNHYVQVRDDDPLYQLLQKPNYLMDSDVFIQSLVTNLFLDGHVWFLPFPIGSKFPSSIWIIRKNNIKYVLDDKTGHLKYWEYSANNKNKNSDKINPEDIGSILFYNPYDPFIGVSPLDAGSLNIMTDYQIACYNNNFFKNGAVPTGALKTPRKLGKEDKKELRTAFNAQHKGYQHSHNIAILSGGLEYQKIGLSYREMDLLTLAKYNKREIEQLLGMKPAILGETDDINYSIYKEQKKEWWQDTNLPIMKMISTALTYKLCRGTKKRIRFDTSSIEAIHEEYSKKVETGYKLWIQGIPFNDINEKLELGFNNIKGGDVGYLLSNMLPVTSILNEDNGGKSVSKNLVETRPVEEILIENKLKKLVFNMRVESLKLLSKNKKIKDYSFSKEKKKLIKDIIPLYKSIINNKNEKNLEKIDLFLNYKEKEIILLINAIKCSIVNNKEKNIKNLYNKLSNKMKDVSYKEYNDIINFVNYLEK